MVTNNTYDDVGNLISSTEIVNGVSRTTSSTYNALGQVTSTTDALGNTTQYQYNAAGQVTKTTFADGSTIVDKYDSQGNKIAEIDQNGVETDYTVQPVWRAHRGDRADLSRSRVPAALVNPTYSYTYDIYGDQTSTTDAMGHNDLYV